MTQLQASVQIPAIPLSAGKGPISTGQVAAWSCLGGLFVVLFDSGLLQAETINDFLSGPQPGAQLAGYAIMSVISVAASVTWGLLHRPIHSIKVAFQLGLIAPAAIAAILSTGAPAHGAQHATALLGQVGKELVISPAIAQEDDQVTEPKESGTLRCILQGMLRQRC